MSTRSQKRRSIPQESNEKVSESMTFPVAVKNEGTVDQDVLVAGPSRVNFPREENSSSIE